MENKHKIYNYFEEKDREKVPVYFNILRKAIPFKTIKRISESDTHKSKMYHVGFLDKPIANLFE